VPISRARGIPSNFLFSFSWECNSQISGENGNAKIAVEASK